jgi:Mrp family chromosome partitioning ATPase
MSTKLNGSTPETAESTHAVETRAAARPATVDVPRRRGASYYDSLLWRLLGRVDDVHGTGQMVGLTGCGRRAGVSTVAANLAIRAADHGVSPTLLVDANFHYPRQRQLLHARKGAGLADVLTGRTSLAEAIHTTKIAGLSLLPLGSRDAIQRSAVDHDQLDSLMKELRHEYRLVVFDFAEAQDLHHGLLFASQLDAALLVLRAEAVRRRVAENTVNRLISDGVNLVGTVVTGQKHYAPQWLRRWI